MTLDLHNDDQLIAAAQAAIYIKAGQIEYDSRRYEEAAQGFHAALDLLAQNSHGEQSLVYMEAMSRFYLGMCAGEGVDHDYHACLTEHLRAIDLLESLPEDRDICLKRAMLYSSVAEISEMFDDDDGAHRYYELAQSCRDASQHYPGEGAHGTEIQLEGE